MTTGCPITRAELDTLFERMRQAGWSADEGLLWGYYFTTDDPVRLEAAARCLAALGYRVARIRPDEHGAFQWLHVEFFERHTPDSLHARNEALFQLATRLGLRSYDGCDVRPVETPLAQHGAAS